MPSLAISVMPLENRLDVIRGLAASAERLDYEAFLVPETWSYDAHALLAAIARETERITLGPAVINCWSRSPAIIAMGAATLAALSRGRSLLGLGAGTHNLPRDCTIRFSSTRPSGCAIPSFRSEPCCEVNEFR